MPRTSHVFAVLGVASVFGLFGALQLIDAARGAERDDPLLLAVLDADDRRDGAAETLETFLEGATSSDVEVRRMAVRAIGRAERADWLAHAVAQLDDPSPAVRAEAANAVGQAVWSGERVPAAFTALVERLAEERDQLVKGVLIQTLGRLSYHRVNGASASAEMTGDAMAMAAERAMVAAMEPMTDALGMTAATRGFESLARIQARAGYRMSDAAVHLLARVVTSGGADSAGVGSPDSSAVFLARARRMSLAALIASQRADRALLEAAIEDTDAGVRRVAILGGAAHMDPEVRASVIMHAPNDPSPMVRYEIIRAFSRFMMESRGCLPLGDALEDRNPHVTLQVLIAMAGCPPAEVESFLVQVFAALPAPTGAEQVADGWQHPMQAFMSLVRVSPGIATRALSRPVNHPQWQARMYAARAAAVLEQTDVLYRVPTDAHHNVRTAALQGLGATVGHAADTTYRRNLSGDDYQLVMTAAQLLEGAEPDSETLGALRDALGRITEQRRETSRDVRSALIGRIGELGDAASADAMNRYLSDFDPVIADSAAAIISRWTSRSVTADPQPLPRQPFPSLDELREWEQTTALLHMQGGGAIEIRLRPFDAPTNVARFVRLARHGFFDGLTFHRVVPNFVIQGGSPGANEYAGDAPYTRDELTRAGHWRGTVGLSTRGRDTGDGQLFVNLVDNVRLDHNYTLFGEVISGMEVVDNLMEGAVIE